MLSHFPEENTQKKPQAEKTVDLIKRFLIAELLFRKTRMDTANSIPSSVCPN